jgi:hypothetical protein
MRFLHPGTPIGQGLDRDSLPLCIVKGEQGFRYIPQKIALQLMLSD